MKLYWAPRRGAHIKQEGYSLFQHTKLLEEGLEPLRPLRIILSTSW